MGERVALVTGGSEGIGLGIARRLAERGIERIILVARKEEKLRAAQTELHAVNPAIHIDILPADLTQNNAYDTIYDFVAKNYNRLDILVNNAGTFLQVPAQNKDGSARTRPSEIATDIKSVTDLNEVPPLVFAVAFYDLLTKSNAKVLDVLSSAALEVFSGNIPYRQTKIAHEDVSLALQYYSEGKIKTYRVYPSNTDTKLVSHFDVKKLTPERVGQLSVDMLLDDSATDLYVRMQPDGTEVLASYKRTDTNDSYRLSFQHKLDRHAAFSHLFSR